MKKNLVGCEKYVVLNPPAHKSVGQYYGNNKNRPKIQDY